MSHPQAQNGGMKLNLLAWLRQDDAVLLAGFGDARLVKKPSGKFELRGGSPADRAEAREWCSLFMHDAVFACASLPLPPTASRRLLQPGCA